VVPRTFRHGEFPAERLANERQATVSVCLPAREEAATIGPIVEGLMALREQGVLDEVVVIDAASGDGTAEVAARAGATVHQEADLLPAFGPVLGKGDAMWRALSVLRGDVVCYLDADSESFGPHFACGLVGPLVCEAGVSFVKGFFRRPFRVGDVTLPHGGGRVNELMARPLLNLFYPELAGFHQPLAGEIAARRDLLERLPYSTGYAIEIAHLLDAYRAVGLAGLAQVDLDVRQNRHQDLDALAPMAFAILQAVAARLEREGRLEAELPTRFLAPARGELVERSLELRERPPMAELRAPTGTGA
jgi:glucosyl-3-phosphoglycerate synthase